MTTPARRQYLRMKSQYPDTILMYQVGDFYETFDEDARITARELQIVLTNGIGVVSKQQGFSRRGIILPILPRTRMRARKYLRFA